jgi:hypothetical protein
VSEEPLAVDADIEELSFWERHRFLALIGATIIISFILVVISMTIYNVSGSAQLDLSRPGYISVSDQVERDDTIDSYSAFGPVNDETVKEFTDLYDAQAIKAKAIEAFNGDPLNPEVLEFGQPTAASQ